MSNNFKKQLEQKRAAVPQIDLEGVKPIAPTVMSVPSRVETPEPETEVAPGTPAQPMQTGELVVPAAPRLTQVNTTETPTNRGFSMYPSRHRQIAKDLAYIEDRKPWEIIEDALEEYVVKHYGKEYKRK